MSLARKTKLIDLVESLPDLWRKTTKKNLNVKKKLWNDVGTELGMDGCDARRKWETLRDQFRREYKRYIQDNSCVSKWIFYNRMLFLRHALRPKDCPIYVDDSSSSDTEESVSEEVKHLDIDVSKIVDSVEKLKPQSTIQVRQNSHEDTESSHSQAAELSTSVGVSSSCQQLAWHEESICSSPNRKRRRCQRQSSDDEDYHFVMSILPSLRSVQQKMKLRIRSKIMELIATELDAGAEAENQFQMSVYTGPKTESEEIDD